MNEIDLNDTVTVELSEWGATYLGSYIRPDTF